MRHQRTDSLFSIKPNSARSWADEASTYHVRGTRWRSWLRYCATSRKIAVSIPDGVVGIFHWHYLSGRTVAPRSTQPLTEMSTRNFLGGGGVKGAGAKGWQPYHLHMPIVLKSGNLNSCSPMGLSRPVMGLFTFTVHTKWGKILCCFT